MPEGSIALRLHLDVEAEHYIGDSLGKTTSLLTDNTCCKRSDLYSQIRRVHARAKNHRSGHQANGVHNHIHQAAWWVARSQKNTSVGICASEQNAHWVFNNVSRHEWEYKNTFATMVEDNLVKHMYQAKSVCKPSKSRPE